MKTVYLFDIDLIERSKYPNFPKLPNHALMKLSAYYKQKGYKIKLVYTYKLIPPRYNPENIYLGSALYSYNLQRFKKRMTAPAKINNQLRLKHIKIGTPLDRCPITDIQGLKCDYSEYDKMLKETDIKLQWYPKNIGFLTRYCIRHCSFCVNRNRNEILRVNSLEEIYQKKGVPIELLDDNLFAYKDADKLLNEIAQFHKKEGVIFSLRNGLDCREVTIEKAKALNNARFAFENMHMAWDNPRNTYIFKNIALLRKNVSKMEFRCHVLIGEFVKTENELYKDLLGLFYRYYNLRRIHVKPVFSLFEDDSNEYINPYWDLYTTIRKEYYMMNMSKKTYLRRKLPINKEKLADKIEDILGEYKWLVTKTVGEIIDDPQFDNKFERIAREINAKHYKINIKD